MSVIYNLNIHRVLIFQGESAISKCSPGLLLFSFNSLVFQVHFVLFWLFLFEFENLVSLCVVVCFLLRLPTCRLLIVVTCVLLTLLYLSVVLLFVCVLF